MENEIEMERLNVLINTIFSEFCKWGGGQLIQQNFKLYHNLNAILTRLLLSQNITLFSTESTCISPLVIKCSMKATRQRPLA